MRPTRRKMVLGIGALATGSGAAFSSAAFQSSVNPAADMRVVVGQQFGNNLRVDAGNIFRQNDGTFNPGSGTNADNTVYDITGSNTEFFSGNQLSDLDVADLPAAGANDDRFYNEDLSLAVATAVGETAVIGDGGSNDVGFIQVENNTPDDHSVQIEFEEFGSDVTSGPVDEAQVRGIYTFYDSDRSQISESPNGNIPESVTVESGTIEQIYLVVDTETENLYNAVIDATNTDDSPFTAEQDTVNLVNQIRVGVTE